MIIYYQQGPPISTNDPEQIDWVKLNRPKASLNSMGCMAEHPEDGWTCSRTQGHKFDHVAYTYQGEPSAMWDRLEADARANPPKFAPGDLVLVHVLIDANEAIRTMGVIEKIASDVEKTYVVWVMIAQKALIKYGSFKFLVHESNIKKIGEYVREGL
jgi:hypothetical protein